MLEINLQFFGGRGSGGGKRTGGGGGSAKASAKEKRISNSMQASKVNDLKEASAWKEGTYTVDDGTYVEESKVEYRTNSNGFTQLYIDGNYSGSEVQVLKFGPDAGKYSARNLSGELKVTASAKVAAKWAFGSPKDEPETWKLKTRKK